jgi:hydrogenase nickel incorporation protein HypA/HybF
MHELGIAQNIVDIVNQYVPEGQERLVRSVRLKVGRLSGVIPESLEFCFSTIIGETPLDSAKLDIEHTPVTSRCCDCGEEFTVDGAAFSCPSCGENDLDLISGTELQVVEIELADERAED